MTDGLVNEASQEGDKEVQSYPQVVASENDSSAGAIVCFPGSGDDTLSSWAELLKRLRPGYCTHFLDRRPDLSSNDSNTKLTKRLASNVTNSWPVILLAHSAGGMYAKQYLKDFPDAVDGMILVECGKALEPTCRRAFNCPLIVITGNSLLYKRRQLVEAGVNTNDSAYMQLVLAEEHDQKLEREQLRWSKNAKLVQVPDCGHNIVRDRPDVILMQVEELTQLLSQGHPESKAYPLKGIRKWFRR